LLLSLSYLDLPENLKRFPERPSLRDGQHSAGLPSGVTDTDPELQRIGSASL